MEVGPVWKLILLDLDGTLLRSDKTISPRTLAVLARCREKGCAIAVCTARGASNAAQYVARVQPDFVVSSGGAFVQAGGETLYCSAFSAEETARLVQEGLRLTGGAEITVDTMTHHYWNYRQDPRRIAPDWNDVVYTDYRGFCEPALKISVQTESETVARQIAACVADCDWAPFSDAPLYKFTKASATKERAIEAIAAATGIAPAQMIAFGDDYVDLGMLRMCGCGVAMGNAIAAVRQAADDVTGTNDADGVAEYLEKRLL